MFLKRSSGNIQIKLPRNIKWLVIEFPKTTISTSTKKISWKNSRKTRVIIQEVKEMMMRKILRLMTSWYFWMKNNKSREDRFGKTKIGVGSTSKLLKFKGEK